MLDESGIAVGTLTSVLECPLNERDLRVEQEKILRKLARLAPSRAERIDLVDQANRIRPWTVAVSGSAPVGDWPPGKRTAPTRISNLHRAGKTVEVKMIEMAVDVHRTFFSRWAKPKSMPF
jgi:hypothetical protein